jgi:uncharacterized membrane protein
MNRKPIYLVSFFLLMLVTGVFWGTWFTLTRSIESFSPNEFIHIGKVIIANVAIPMRFLMPGCILFLILSLWVYQKKSTPIFYLGVLSLIFIIAVLLITILVLVPIDNDIKGWTAETVPQAFAEIRQSWKTYHAVRTFLSLASFVSFTLFVLWEPGK